MQNLKLSTLLLAGSLLLGIISCKKTELADTAFKESPEKPTQAAAKAAQVYRYQTTIDLAVGWSEYNACNGNIIDITEGIYHIDFIYTINSNRFTFVDHSNVSNYKLTDLTTGVNYTGSYVSNFSLTGNIATDFPIEVTGTLKILLTTRGGGNNGALFVDYHGTINANGIEAVWFYNYRAGCQ